MKPILRLLSVGLIIVSVASCASTPFTSTWKAPGARALDPRGHKIAAVYISSDEASRRIAEDVLVRKFAERGAQGVATYSLIPTSEIDNMSFVKQQLVEAGVDGVFTIRVIGENERTTVTFGGAGPVLDPYYWSFSGYWGHGWAYPYEPAHVRTDTLLRTETLVYSLEREELLWAGTSRTTTPTSLEKFVARLADQAAKQMMEEGVLAARADAEPREVRLVGANPVAM
jgi:hypothetical protein